MPYTPHEAPSRWKSPSWPGAALLACAVLPLVPVLVACGSADNRASFTGANAGAAEAATASISAAAAPIGVWTRLTIPGVGFRRPASWRSNPLPHGVTPGPRLLVDILTTDPGDACRTATRRDVVTAIRCPPGLAPGGVLVTWWFQAQPARMPATTTTVAGRRAVRDDGPATGQCRASGGVRQMRVTLGGTAERRDTVDLVLEACLADPGAATAASQVEEMLASLSVRP